MSAEGRYPPANLVSPAPRREGGQRQQDWAQQDFENQNEHVSPPRFEEYVDMLDPLQLTAIRKRPQATTFHVVNGYELMATKRCNS